jgi:hypothetical protein
MPAKSVTASPCNWSLSERIDLFQLIQAVLIFPDFISVKTPFSSAIACCFLAGSLMPLIFALASSKPFLHSLPRLLAAEAYRGPLTPQTISAAITTHINRFMIMVRIVSDQ